MKDNWMAKENTGMWTVLDQYIVTEKGERKYLCRCDCGTERYVLERSLKSGGSKSCGCQRKLHAKEATELKLDGQKFGELTVICRSKEAHSYGGIWWRCFCSCGNIIEVPGTLLINGRKTHCGCKSGYHFTDISGKKFNALTALYVVSRKHGEVVWHCRCDCGTELDLSYNELVYSNRKSCGCLKSEHNKKLNKALTHFGGTSLDMIKSKTIPSDNTTGVRGVYYIKGKYHAKIVFRKKAYYLGVYDKLEDASRARANAEAELFDSVIEHYNKWLALAQADPEWAKCNPIEISVEKLDTNRLRVHCFPLIDL